MNDVLAAEARAAVLGRLDAALYWWVEEERFLLEAGRQTEADGAHRYVLWVDRAAKAERDDPDVEKAS